jgi:hypothetical protein
MLHLVLLSKPHEQPTLLQVTTCNISFRLNMCLSMNGSFPGSISSQMNVYKIINEELIHKVGRGERRRDAGGRDREAEKCVRERGL